MSNPLDEYFESRPALGEKRAAFPFAPQSQRMLAGAARHLGEGALQGAGALAGAGLVGLAGAAYGAITKRRDFREMLDVAPDLAATHESDPRRINSYYDSARRMVPQYMRDPYIAATIMRQMDMGQSSGAGPGGPLLGLAEKSKGQDPQLTMGFGGGKGPSFSIRT